MGPYGQSCGYDGAAQPEDDMVARRIVLRRSVWDRLVKIAEHVTKVDRPISPCEVAVLALEAALDATEAASKNNTCPESSLVAWGAHLLEKDKPRKRGRKKK